MDIFGNLIKDTEIIGISSLNVFESRDASGTTIQYSFKVFTHSNAVLIYSQSFNGRNSSKHVELWINNYNTYRAEIAAQIGEISKNA